MLQRQIKMRRLDDYLMQLAIISNPTKEPEVARDFVEELLNERRFMRGEPEAPAELDVEAFSQLQTTLKNQSKMIKVK